MCFSTKKLQIVQLFIVLSTVTAVIVLCTPTTVLALTRSPASTPSTKGPLSLGKVFTCVAVSRTQSFPTGLTPTNTVYRILVLFARIGSNRDGVSKNLKNLLAQFYGFIGGPTLEQFAVFRRRRMIGLTLNNDIVLPPSASSTVP